MNLDELIAKVPERFRPVAQEYGPAFLQMGEQEVVAWINKLAKGNVFEAYSQVLANLENRALLDEWAKTSAEWDAANAREAERRAVAARAQAALMGVLLSIAVAMVGL